MKVMIVVTHLLGTGHLTRAITLAQAFQSAGHAAIVVSGGLPVERFNTSGIEVVQLPPVRSDGVDFSRLLDASGMLADDRLKQDRCTQLIDTLTEFRPDALITELFPFGRRILKDEFTALLTAAKLLEHPPAIFASIRDILAPPSKAKKVHFADHTIAANYDAVLVHADAEITPLDLSWPVSEALRPKLCYTGFVAQSPAQPHPNAFGAGEIIVSAGGGAVGAQLFDCARAAAGNDTSRTWRILVGGQDNAARIADLQDGASHNLIIETARPDFRQMLYHAAASVSFCGYNTAQDLLQAACPAVLVPFDAGNEVEQGIRADALDQLPGFEVLRSANLSADALMSKVATARAAPQREPTGKADGADQTVAIVKQITMSRKT